MKSKLKIEKVFEIIDKLKELYPEDVTWAPNGDGSKEYILEIEKKLAVKFPEDFEKFILKYRNWLHIWGEVVGSQTLSYTLQSRELGEGDPDYFPEYLIYVCDYGGVYVCIDTSQNNQIIYWDEVMAGEDEDGNCVPNNKVIWHESFTEFLFYYVVDSYEYKCERDHSIKEERARYEPDDEPIDEPDEESVVFDKEVEILKKEIEYLKTLSSHYNKDKPYLTLV